MKSRSRNKKNGSLGFPPPVDKETPEVDVTLTLRLTKLELRHIRDLFSVLLPTTTMKETVSQNLAVSQIRTLTEAKLWQKIIALCVDAKLLTGQRAPDFVISPVSTPTMGVFELSQESGDEAQEPSRTVFDEDSNSEECEEDEDDEEDDDGELRDDEDEYYDEDDEDEEDEEDWDADADDVAEDDTTRPWLPSDDDLKKKKKNVCFRHGCCNKEKKNKKKNR